MFRALAIAAVLSAAAARAQNSQPDEDWSRLPGTPPPSAPPATPSKAQPPPNLPVFPGAPSTPVQQAQPVDEAWGGFPNAAPPRTPPPTPPISSPPEVSAPPVMPAPASPSLTRRAPEPPMPPNTVSVFGAPTLGQWKRGQGVLIGFPVIALRLALGVFDRLDVGFQFESMYGLLNDLRGTLKLGLVEGPGLSLSLAVDGGGAFFATPAARETRGPRWLTGRRNFALSPSLVLSYQGSSSRSARLFVTARYLLAFDTEPFAKDPLGGVPANLVLGHNGSLTIGAELPLTPKTSFVFAFGLEVHGRSEDTPLMPTAQVGLATQI